MWAKALAPGHMDLGPWALAAGEVRGTRGEEAAAAKAHGTGSFCFGSMAVKQMVVWWSQID